MGGRVLDAGGDGRHVTADRCAPDEVSQIAPLLVAVPEVERRDPRVLALRGREADERLPGADRAGVRVRTPVELRCQVRFPVAGSRRLTVVRRSSVPGRETTAHGVGGPSQGAGAGRLGSSRRTMPVSCACTTSPLPGTVQRTAPVDTRRASTRSGRSKTATSPTTAGGRSVSGSFHSSFPSWSAYAFVVLWPGSATRTAPAARTGSDARAVAARSCVHRIAPVLASLTWQDGAGLPSSGDVEACAAGGDQQQDGEQATHAGSLSASGMLCAETPSTKPAS